MDPHGNHRTARQTGSLFRHVAGLPVFIVDRHLLNRKG